VCAADSTGMDHGLAHPELCNADGDFEDSCGHPMPTDERACEDYSLCLYKVQCSDWQACKADCGDSTMERDCWCWRSDGAIDVPMEECTMSGVPQPSQEKACSSFETCKYMWHVDTKHVPFGDGTCSDETAWIDASVKGVADLDHCEDICKKTDLCAYYSYSEAHSRSCEMYESCPGLSTLVPGFKTYMLAGTHSVRSTKWRVASGSDVDGCWGVCELEFYSDESCTAKLAGTPIASAARSTDVSAGNAFDGDDWCGDKTVVGQWGPECGYPGSPVVGGKHWIGMDFDFLTEVKCVRVKQTGSAPSSLVVQSYDGMTWFDQWPILEPYTDGFWQVSTVASSECRKADAPVPSSACPGSRGQAGCTGSSDCAPGLTCQIDAGTLYGLPDLSVGACTDDRLLALDFRGDGSNYVKISMPTRALNTEFSVSLWAKALDERAEGRLVSKPRVDGGTGWNIQVLAGKVEFFGMGDPVRFWGTGKVPMDVGEWNLITVTFSQSARKLYLNGDLAAVDAGGPTIALTEASEESPLLIGREFLTNYQDGRPLKYMRLAKIALWDKELEDSEVMEMYASRSAHMTALDNQVGVWDSARDVEPFAHESPLAASEDYPDRN